ncbi:MAG: amino acid transporter permease protein [Firmicutes bacterium]|nr:amino acid transporter permease protein [Bacillota bacterium]
MNLFAGQQWQALFEARALFAKGLGQTVVTSALALLLSLVIGAVIGALGTAPWRIARAVNRTYVDLVQNLPLVTLVAILFFGLPHLGVNVPVFGIGVLCLGVYHGAYIAEVIRAGIQSIHRGQLEAAFSQGFTYVKAMRHIILPQAFQVILPPLTNQAVSLIKNSAVLNMIGAGEMMNVADSWAGQNSYYGPTYLLIWALFFALCFPLAQWARRLEQRAIRARGQEVQAR